jgi:hypothetical protein
MKWPGVMQTSNRQSVETTGVEVFAGTRVTIWFVVADGSKVGKGMTVLNGVIVEVETVALLTGWQAVRKRITNRLVHKYHAEESRRNFLRLILHNLEVCGEKIKL